MLESEYKTQLTKKLQRRYPDCIVTRLPSSHLQGIPDMLVLIGSFWAVLEAKAHSRAAKRPNQDYYVELMNGMSFAAFIHPENEEEVLDALQQALESSWYARVV